MVTWDDFMIWAGLPAFAILAFASFCRLIGPFDDRYPVLTGAATAAFVSGAYLVLRWGELRADYAVSLGVGVIGASLVAGLLRAVKCATRSTGGG